MDAVRQFAAAPQLMAQDNKFQQEVKALAEPPLTFRLTYKFHARCRVPLRAACVSDPEA
jgi:hypothetical protein